MDSFRSLVVMLILFTSLVVSDVDASTSSTNVRIELRKDVVLAKRDVTVDDVAVVIAGDPELQAMIGSLRIGTAPRVGYADRMMRTELERIIRTRIGNANLQMDWDGAQAVTVRTEVRVADTTEVIGVAKRYLEMQIGSAFKSVDVELVSPIKDVEIPVGVVSFVPHSTQFKSATSRIAIWVDVYVDGVIARSVVVPFFVKVMQSAYIAKRRIPEGSLVTASDFDIGLEVVSPNADKFVTIAGLENMNRVRKTLEVGQALTSNHVAASDTVLRGDHVKLLVVNPAFVIETNAIAQHDAIIGQLIKVRPENGTDTVVGRVTGLREVKTDER